MEAVLMYRPTVTWAYAAIIHAKFINQPYIHHFCIKFAIIFKKKKEKKTESTK